jgi:D-alanyl-D-alanine-carboxypeptidase/D-alanyl-D-alanine-endopeptidase
VEFEDLVADAANSVVRRRWTSAATVGAFAGSAEATASCGIARPSIPADSRSMYEIGSLTKLFTGLILADMVVNAELDIDAPASSFLDHTEELPTYGGTQITLGHLATHTSGLPDSPLSNLAYLRSDAFSKIDDRQVLAAAALARLKRLPGTGSPSYSNLGFAILGIVLVRAAGAASYSDLVTRRVCDPLSLPDTVTVPGAEQIHRVAQGFRWGNRASPPWRLTGLVAAGGLLSTITDVLRFLREQARPVSSLGPAILKMQSLRIGTVDDGIGIAWMLSRSNQTVVMHHSGGTGGFRSWVGVNPEQNAGVALMSAHADLGRLDHVGEALLAAITHPTISAPHD